MATQAPNANGHRRRELVKRVMAEEHDCALCDQPVDKRLRVIPGQHMKTCPTADCRGCAPHDMRAEVDEDIPRARGGSPTDRANCHLMHRKCNRYKGTMTLAEARAKLHGTSTDTPARRVTASPIW